MVLKSGSMMESAAADAAAPAGNGGSDPEAVEQAARLFAEQEALAPTFSQSMRMGVEAFKQADFDTAVDAFTEAHTLKPSLPIPPYNIACCHAKLGKPPTSVSWLRTALALQRRLDERGVGAGAGTEPGETAQQTDSAAPIGSIGITEVLDDPDFDAIHSHPLFEALLREETAKPDPAAAAQTEARAGWKKAKALSKRDSVKKKRDKGEASFMDVAGLCKAEVDAEVASRQAAAAAIKEEKRKAARVRIAQERRRAREERKKAREEAVEKEAQKTLALTKVLENADLALQQAAVAAGGKPRRKLPSGALPGKVQPRRKKGKSGTGERQPTSPAGGAVEKQQSSFVLPAVGGAAPAPEPEQQVSEAHEADQLERSPVNTDRSPEQRTKPKLSKGERAALASCHRKPGGAHYPRSHPFLKDTSPTDRGLSDRAFEDITVSTYNGIRDHLEDSPPDHHRPIPKSLTASFAQAGIVRERGLVHGGSAAEHVPDEDADGSADAESEGEADDASSVTSSGFMSLAANLAEARLGEDTGAAASADADLDMDFIINEADAALRQALQAQGLVVGGADTQERLTEFVTDSLRTTQRFRETAMEDIEASPSGSSMRRGITAQQISRAVEAAAQVEGDCILGGRNIGPSGGRVLVAALVRHRLRVKAVMLQDNMLGDMGVEALAAVLSVCASIRTLDLSWNRIGRKGAQALASSLAAGASSPSAGLRSLCLRGNRIGDAGAMRIADALGGGRCSLTRRATPDHQHLFILFYTWIVCQANAVAATAATLPLLCPIV